MKLHQFPVFHRSQDDGRLFKGHNLSAFERAGAEMLLALSIEDGLAPPGCFLGGCECEVDYVAFPAYWIVPS